MKKIFRYKGGQFESGKTLVMGILNVTPDSFSDGGRYSDVENAVKHAQIMVDEGADIIDIGAMSTRPGSEEITETEEIARLEPVLKKLNGKIKAVISVDTFNADTAEYALNNGAGIINDVSGKFSKEMAEVIKKHRAGWIVMHSGNVPSGTVIEYPDGVVASVNSFFDEMIMKCKNVGIGREYLCLDAGFGFAKTAKDNIELLDNLEKVIRADTMFLTALSKKRFIGAVTGRSETDDRVIGTVAADTIAVMKGSDIVRVHNVKEAVDAAKICDALKNAGDCNG